MHSVAAQSTREQKHETVPWVCYGTVSLSRTRSYEYSIYMRLYISLTYQLRQQIRNLQGFGLVFFGCGKKLRKSVKENPHTRRQHVDKKYPPDNVV